MNHNNRFRLNALIAATTLVAGVCLPRLASAQDYGAMVQQSMNRMNQIIANAQQASNTMVQQRMRDPQVHASYQQHVAQSRASGRPAMDYPTYTYNYIYTRGFTREGIAHAQASAAGRGLMGQSTYRAGNGASAALPHTWQANSRHEYEGNTYHVNESGQYLVRGSDGYWDPLAR